ncbi:MAPEG family protein [Ovoidimarina sediminis]|uniref:MAPEG family protein n=1 Tax=Ovoidimarina sediminis TaxID=3079856 RepID=UPI0029086459|nr:MAPEG family protein [Rhodophyticola sp. MJ-SS7]MDU8944615.1 MAPEG family protein [Rhodophyticola sp. MJ-SS7]
MLGSELTILLVYGLYTALVLGAKVTGMMATVDMGYLLSSRDEGRTLEGMLGRLDRAINNSVTAMALFAPPVIVIALRDQSSGASLLAAQVFLICRLIYVPAYMFGIRGVRTLVWFVAFLATLILYFLAL